MKKLFVIFAAAVFCAAFILSGCQLWRYFTAEREVSEAFDSLSRQVATPPVYEPIKPGKAEADENGDAADAAGVPEWTAYDKYAALFEQNNDMIGWIKIEGTAIDYPVMQSPDRPDFYLKHGFEEQLSDYGVPYAGENCSINPRSGNIVIYGHHMKSGKMFGILESYKSRSFWLEHPTIQFDTRAGFGRYEIIAVFKVSPSDFRYNEFVDATDEAEFDRYVSRCKKLSFYDTGISASFDDKLITLSTCEYSQADSRLVIVARQV